MYLGEVIKSFRHKHHLSMQTFADMAGLSKPYISQLERNRNPKTGDAIVPSPDTFQKVAKAMDVTFNDLISAVDENQPLVIMELKNSKPQDDFNVSRKPDVLPGNIMLPAARALPVLSTFEPGTRELNNGNFDGKMFVDATAQGDYCMQVSDSNMEDARIAQNDYAFLSKDFELVCGNIYAIALEEGGLPALRKLVSKGEDTTFESCNNNEALQRTDSNHCFVIGELIGLYHSFK